MTTETRDESVATLERFFLDHPVWIRAGRRIREGASSKVFFSHLPGEPWHLLREAGRSRLRPGPAPEPDFAFQFTPTAIDRLAAVKGGVGDFAVELFSLITDPDDSVRVGFRIIAPFSRLAQRGYVRLLIDGGPTLLAYGAVRGVHTLRELRQIVEDARAKTPADWEIT